MSGKVVAEKYFLLGCSLVLCSREYCSIVLSRYVLRPNSSGSLLKNSPDCLPISSIHVGGNPSISVIRATWLYSEDPGNNGRPRKSSTTMQPSDHMSIAAEYLDTQLAKARVYSTKTLTVSQVILRGTGRILTGYTCTRFAVRHTPSRNR